MRGFAEFARSGWGASLGSEGSKDALPQLDRARTLRTSMIEKLEPVRSRSDSGPRVVGRVSHGAGVGNENWQLIFP